MNGNGAADTVTVGVGGISGISMHAAVILAIISVVVLMGGGSMFLLTVYHRAMASLRETINAAVGTALDLRFTRHEKDEAASRHGEIEARERLGYDFRREVDDLKRQIDGVRHEVSEVKMDVRALRRSRRDDDPLMADGSEK